MPGQREDKVIMTRESSDMRKPGQKPGDKIHTNASSSHLKKTGSITEVEKRALLQGGHHVEHTPDDDMEHAPKRFDKAVKTVVYIPEDRMVKVPVVRKEKERIVEKHTIKATKLVPVTKYKEVKEINLHDKMPAPGELARSGCPKTQVLKTSEQAKKTRKIPYTDYIEQEYEVTVDVPRERVKTRVGYRMDRVMTSNAVEISEDCVFEMRPVLIRRGEAKAKELDHLDSHGKGKHGEPVWEGSLIDGWHPEYGCITPVGSRPGTGASRPGTGMSRPGTGLAGMAGVSSGMQPIREFTSRPGSRGGRPGTGSRSAPNLQRL